MGHLISFVKNSAAARLLTAAFLIFLGAQAANAQWCQSFYDIDENSAGSRCILRMEAYQACYYSCEDPQPFDTDVRG
jgi:hypothetical protein